MFNPNNEKLYELHNNNDLIQGLFIFHLRCFIVQ